MFALKSLLLLATVGCFYAKSGDVAACRVVCIVLYLKSAWVYVYVHSGALHVSSTMCSKHVEASNKRITKQDFLH